MCPARGGHELRRRPGGVDQHLLAGGRAVEGELQALRARGQASPDGAPGHRVRAGRRDPQARRAGLVEDLDRRASRRERASLDLPRRRRPRRSPGAEQQPLLVPAGGGPPERGSVHARVRRRAALRRGLAPGADLAHGDREVVARREAHRLLAAGREDGDERARPPARLPEDLRAVGREAALQPGRLQAVGAGVAARRREREHDRGDRSGSDHVLLLPRRRRRRSAPPSAAPASNAEAPLAAPPGSAAREQLGASPLATSGGSTHRPEGLHA